ncbi:hypothetical protein OF385_07535 [Glutamicibacter sp. JL.03c]|uniref:hypothetical protein n=1 Tax=Glutamicibacter sp. JL.03c TaxID=2984842 RepID=UPI0021F78A56|nr:hypothetical protein [Glutamicibacter sp. JL.03c]UYQ78975.1 hypothetical protein OF385_07535 [Glutamicibacter sp. JL.03c]
MSVSGARTKMLAAGLLLGTLFAAGCARPAPDAVNAQWSLMDSSAVTPESTSLDLGVMRMACGSGITGEITGTQVAYSAEDITIGLVVEELDGKAQTCQSNETVPYTIKLDEPVGNRTLTDASCAEAERQQSTLPACEQHGIRWAP